MASLGVLFKQLLGPDKALIKRPLIKLNTINTELYDYGRGATVVNIEGMSIYLRT